MTDPFRILVVGVGNISRSPLVERHLRHQLDQALGDAAGAVEVSSAGARAISGAIMSVPAALELERVGGTPNGFAARQLTRELMREADLVLTATRALRSRVLEDEPAALRRTFTVREFAGLAQLPLSAVRRSPSSPRQRLAAGRPTPTTTISPLSTGPRVAGTARPRIGSLRLARRSLGCGASCSSRPPDLASRYPRP